MNKIYSLILVVIVFIGLVLWMNRSTVAIEPPVVDETVESIEEVVVTPALSFSTNPIKQGDPGLITVEGALLEEIKSLTFNGKRLSLFEHEGKLSALVGIDLRMTPATYDVVLSLTNGEDATENLIVASRKIVQEPLGIPDKLGGNTPESEKQLVNTLVQEGALISAVPTTDKKLWDGEFRLPVDPPIVVTDTYGYSRLTGASSISHKGTDYRAAIGTPIFAMNSGKVRFTQNLRNYGNTIIIDHGLGLHTIYMHLSEIKVTLGQDVTKGEFIARSGDTGYVLGPHLHLTIRIGGISIDPEKFMALFGSSSN